jgi:hypothetical protein
VFVVIDTQIFVRDTHLLRKQGGRDLIRLLGAVKGRLVIPDVCLREYIEQTRAFAAQEQEKIRTSLSKLETLTGYSTTVALLDNPAVDVRTRARLAILQGLVHPVGETKELLVAASRRSMAKRRPASSNDDAIKDCLIWESLLTLPAGSDVRLVSRDVRAFYDNGQFAAELAEEARARGLRVLGAKDLHEVVKELQASNPALDLAALSADDPVEFAEPESDMALVVDAPSAPRAGALDSAPMENVEQRAKLVRSRLGDAQRTAREEEQRVLGYIAYFGDANKSQLFAALEQSGLALPLAHNIAERLALVGLVQDTGHHYIVPDRELAGVAASLVEADIIALLDRGN